MWARFRLRCYILFHKGREGGGAGNTVIKNRGLRKIGFRPRWRNRDWIYPPNENNNREDKIYENDFQGIGHQAMKDSEP